MMSETFDTTAARLLRIDQRPPDEILGDGDDHGTISVRELAAALRAAHHEGKRERLTTDGIAAAAIFAQVCEHIDQRLLASDGPAGGAGAFFREMRDDEAATLYRCCETIWRAAASEEDR